MENIPSGFNWKKCRAIAGIYLLTNIVFVIQRVIFDLQQGKPEDIVTSLIDLIGFAGIWVVLILPIQWMTTRWQLSLRNVTALVVIGIVFSVLHAALYLFYALSVPGIMSSTITTFTQYTRTLAGLSHAWRFLSFGFLVVVSYAYDYYYLARERDRRAAQLQIQLTEAKLNALKMQLHPHFLFNTLNAINVLVDENPLLAKRTLAQLSDLLRLALENIETQEVQLSREIEFLDRYLLIQKTRYEHRLTLNMNIDTDTLDAAVPYMIFQPIVENALKHGIDTLPGPGTISISARRENGKLVLQVEDSGSGLRPPPADRIGCGLGLANTQARLQQLYGEQHSLMLEDILERHGTRVTVILPYKSAASPAAGGKHTIA